MAALAHRGSASTPGSRETLLQMQRDAAARIYSPIRRWQTRLLFLQPGDFGDPLEARLRVVNLTQDEAILAGGQDSDDVEYTALSYCWGATDYGPIIRCNDEDYPVTDNLYHALQYLRLQGDVTVLWVDALCINQHDTEERSIQVRKILQIFSVAKSVEAWLGEHGMHTAEALQYLNNTIVPSQYMTPLPTEEELRRVGLEELFQRPWWQRIWVKQEVFAASKLYLRCGGSRIRVPGESLQLLINEALSVATFTLRTPDIRSELAYGERQNIFLEQLDHETDIFNVLRRMSKNECSDTRDLVYGVLGMSRTILQGSQSDERVARFPVSYDKTMSEVFQDVTKYIMERDGVLNVLFLHAHFGTNVAGRKLPSWVPDWKAEVSRLPWLDYYQLSLSRVGTDSELPLIQCSKPFHESGEGGKLTLKGYTLGFVGNRIFREDQVSIIRLKDDQLQTRKWLMIQQSLREHRGLNFAGRHGVDAELSKLDSLEVGKIMAGDAEPRITLHDRDGLYTMAVPRNLLKVTTSRRILAKMRTYREGNSHQRFDARPKEELDNGKFSDTEFITVLPSSRLSSYIADLLQSGVNIQTMLDAYISLGPNIKNITIEKWIPQVLAVPVIAREGDMILIVQGAFSPIVVRPVPSTTTFTYVGPTAFTKKIFDWDISAEVEKAMINQESPRLQWLLLLAILKVREEEDKLDLFDIV